MRPDVPEPALTGRGPPLFRQLTALHERLGNLLALGLVAALGVAVLAVYYLHAAQRRGELRQKQHAEQTSRAQSEMPLPALQPLTLTDANTPQTTDGKDLVSPPLPLPPATALTSPTSAVAATSVPVAKPSSLERRLTGSAYGHVESPTAAAEPVGMAAASGVAANRSSAAATEPAAGLLPRGAFGDTTRAELLPGQRLLLPKGAFIDCTLETAIDSTLPGMTTCITATDTFGADGKVVLLERGTKLVGETRGQVQQGTARLFVIWTEARTPTGVVVPLDSPGTDALGRAGLAGTVDRHFWARFGAALFISTIDGAEQAAIQSAGRNSGTVIYNPTAPTEISTEVLRSTLNVAPTVRKANGDRIQVLVARNIDFTPVYELRRVAAAR
jgi:type IV secretion system protein VirB10